jgi:hypothetical protein
VLAPRGPATGEHHVLLRGARHSVEGQAHRSRSCLPKTAASANSTQSAAPVSLELTDAHAANLINAAIGEQKVALGRGHRVADGSAVPPAFHRRKCT